jgi:hypothetical protein
MQTTPLAESEFEQELAIAGRELEAQFETDFAFAEHESESAFEQPESFWPVVLRVAAVGARGAGPLFRVVGKQLAPAVARTAARQLPGVFVQGTAPQVRNFARKVGGTLVGPERHGTGLPHDHLIRNGDRVHVWLAGRSQGKNFSSKQ